MWKIPLLCLNHAILMHANSLPLNEMRPNYDALAMIKVKVLAMTMVVMVAVAPAATLQRTTACMRVCHKCAGKITARDRVAIYDLCRTFARTNFYGHEQSIHANRRARTHNDARKRFVPIV